MYVLRHLRLRKLFSWLIARIICGSVHIYKRCSNSSHNDGRVLLVAATRRYRVSKLTIQAVSVEHGKDHLFGLSCVICQLIHIYNFGTHFLSMAVFTCGLCPMTSSSSFLLKAHYPSITSNTISTTDSIPYYSDLFSPSHKLSILRRFSSSTLYIQCRYVLESLNTTQSISPRSRRESGFCSGYIYYPPGNLQPGARKEITDPGKLDNDNDFLFSNTLCTKLASVKIEAASAVSLIFTHSLLSKHNISPELVPVDTVF